MRCGGRCWAISTSRNGSSTSDGCSSNAFGLLFGVDTLVTDDVAAGAAFNWPRGFAKGEGDASGNSATTDTCQINLHGSWRPDGKAAWVSGTASWGMNRYDQKRDIDFLNETAKAKYCGGSQMRVKAAVGRDFDLGSGFTAAPQVGARAARVENRGCTAYGGVLAQSVRRRIFNSVETEPGGKLPWSPGETSVGAFSGDVAVDWVHDHIDGPIVGVATLSGVGYEANSKRPPPDGVRVALGAALQRKNDLSLRLEYDGESRGGYGGHTALFKLRQAFRRVSRVIRMCPRADRGGRPDRRPPSKRVGASRTRRRSPERSSSPDRARRGSCFHH